MNLEEKILDLLVETHIEQCLKGRKTYILNPTPTKDNSTTKKTQPVNQNIISINKEKLLTVAEFLYKHPGMSKAELLTEIALNKLKTKIVNDVIHVIAEK